jgi:hypothetical protein
MPLSIARATAISIRRSGGPLRPTLTIATLLTRSQFSAAAKLVAEADGMPSESTPKISEA